MSNETNFILFIFIIFSHKKGEDGIDAFIYLTFRFRTLLRHTNDGYFGYTNKMTKPTKENYSKQNWFNIRHLNCYVDFRYNKL